MSRSERLLSLDAFRGITIAAMILVNNPGTWNAVYAPLLHAKWNGWTPTDLIYPFFLFIIGVAMPFSFSKYEYSNQKNGLLIKVLRRSSVIFLLGIFLHLFPRFDFESLRIAGVLQRIAIGYLFAPPPPPDRGKQRGSGQLFARTSARSAEPCGTQLDS